VDRRKKPFHSIRKTFPVLECKPLYEDQAPRWVETRARTSGKTIDQEAVRLLVAHVGTSLRALDGELAKLVIFAGAREAISADDVAAVVGVSREFSVFELQRVLGTGDTARAVSILEHLLDGGESPTFLLVMLTSYFVALWKVHELRRKEAPRGSIAAEIRVSPYFLQEYLAGAQRFPAPEIEEALCRLAEADAALKTTQADPRQVLHTLLARLLNGKRTNSQAFA
jgi:DNA polymerase-3 subunit delta